MVTKFSHKINIAAFFKGFYCSRFQFVTVLSFRAKDQTVFLKSLQWDYSFTLCMNEYCACIKRNSHCNLAEVKKGVDWYVAFIQITYLYKFKKRFPSSRLQSSGMQFET